MPELPRSPSTSGVGELEWPEEVACLLEVGSDGEDFVHEVFDGEDIVFAEGGFDGHVGGEGDTLFVHLAVSAFVDEFADGFQVGLAAAC